MKRIAIVTATRAEYGLLTPLIKRVIDDNELDLDLIVTGTHLSEKFGHTIDEIIEAGFPIAHQIEILDDDNSPYGISLTMANAIKGFAECFRDDRPDMVIILGDRTEMLGVASAAMNERIPIAHIHGGEVTEGAVDDCVRHAITKMSYLHFTSTEVYRQRVIRLGENPNRVFNVGALGAENILTQQLSDKEAVKADVEIPGDMDYAVVTFHPVTLEDSTVMGQVENLCNAMAQRSDIFFVVTASNSDAGGDEANKLLKAFCGSHDNTVFVHNLGMRRYLSAVKHAAFVLGNSSSGILEAPVLGTPTVNIGDRQKGRLMAETVINCGNDVEDITETIDRVLSMEHKRSLMYGNGETSKLVIQDIKKLFIDGINIKKEFHDLHNQRKEKDEVL